MLTIYVSCSRLVDSRDIVELKLKQLDCEILIRKKEAVQQTHIPNPAHVITMQSPPTVAPSQAPQSSPPTSAPPLPAPAPVAKPAKPSLPPFNSPMSGTFYRSPAPGEPPFVKVGVYLILLGVYFYDLYIPLPSIKLRFNLYFP